jgi:hypothetical protein
MSDATIMVIFGVFAIIVWWAAGRVDGLRRRKR